MSTMLGINFLDEDQHFLSTATRKVLIDKFSVPGGFFEKEPAIFQELQRKLREAHSEKPDTEHPEK